MTPTIRIDDEVFKLLDKKACEMDKQFPSPNDVLRNLLGLPPKKKHSQTKTGARGIRPSGRPETR